ncbi:MAG: hypothetical protein NVS9B12_06220 [Vulcanimicrobiaceae bacterium]
MPALEMRDAAFRRAPLTLLEPVSLSVDQGARYCLSCDTTLGAGIAARMAAGIVKCSSGEVFVGDFDPKIQPVQVKRLVGFLPNDRPRNPFRAEDYFSYRAALWGLDRRAAIEKGSALLAMLDGLEPDEAALLAGIFLHDPQLIVLERPGAGLLAAAQTLANARAVFITFGPSDPAWRPSEDPAPSAGQAR